MISGNELTISAITNEPLDGFSKMNNSIAVPVTGLGCVCARGATVDECMQSMLRGERDPRPPASVVTDHKVQYPVFEVRGHPDVDGPDAADLLRTSKFALVAVAEALAQAGWGRDELRGKRVGVSMGTTVGCAMNNEDFNRLYHDGDHPSMDAITRYLNSNPAEVIAREYELTGPCQTINNACSSGTDAIGLAAGWIRAGICDMAIAGGADELCRIVYSGFISLMNVGDRPCMPFDRDRVGLNLGEGAGVVVLEKEPRNPTGVGVFGHGSACDSYHLTAPKPDGAGLRRAAAFALSDIDVRDIAFINAHGTGTTENDRVEGKVLHDLFPGIPYISTKGYTGHTLGAAGGVEAVFSAWSLLNGVIPKSIGFENLDPEVPAPPATQNTEVSGRYAISDSLAFGGSNGVLVLGRVEA